MENFQALARLASEERDSTSLSDRSESIDRVPTAPGRIGATIRNSSEEKTPGRLSPPTTSATLSIATVNSPGSTPSAANIRRRSQVRLSFPLQSYKSPCHHVAFVPGPSRKSNSLVRCFTSPLFLFMSSTLCCVSFLCSSHLFQQGMPLSRSNRRGTGPVMPEDLQLPKPEMLSSVPSSRNVLASTVNRTLLTFKRTDSRTNTAPGHKSQSVPPGAPTVRDSSEPFSCIQLIYVVARLEALFCMFCWRKDVHEALHDVYKGVKDRRKEIEGSRNPPSAALLTYPVIKCG